MKQGNHLGVVDLGKAVVELTDGEEEVGGFRPDELVGAWSPFPLRLRARYRAVLRRFVPRSPRGTSRPSRRQKAIKNLGLSTSDRLSTDANVAPRRRNSAACLRIAYISAVRCACKEAIAGTYERSPTAPIASERRRAQQFSSPSRLQVRQLPGAHLTCAAECRAERKSHRTAPPQPIFMPAGEGLVIAETPVACISKRHHRPRNPWNLVDASQTTPSLLARL